MIRNPWALAGVLIGIECFVLWISSLPRFKKYFDVIPSLFWIYFLPMLASTFGIIDPKSPVYSQISNWFLPACLFLLLISVDIRAIFSLGRPALIMFFAGSAAVVLAVPFVFFVFKGWTGTQFWSGFGALCGSWTGGSANMIAVKEALGTPDSVFLPMVVVDTVVPYAWMGMLVALVGRQAAFDRWNNADRRILDELSRNAEVAQVGRQSWSVFKTVLIIALAMAASVIAQSIAKFLPVIKDVIAPFAWTVITVSVLGILCSMTPLRKLERNGSMTIGYWLLYFVLTSIGAKASLTDIGSTAVLILAGVMIMLIHGAVMIGVARLIRAPMFLVAAASQANVGGVASASIVAELYQPGFASVGLLLAILGNIVGTYMGILAGQLCRMVI